MPERGRITVKFTSSLSWEGEATLGVLDEDIVKQMGLLHVTAAFLHAIKKGQLLLNRQYRNHNTFTNYARSYLTQVLAETVNGPLALPFKMELGTEALALQPRLIRTCGHQL
jgi:hypothetical protein